jgi:hypothetical protein
MTCENLVPDDVFEILQSDDVFALQRAHRLIDQRIERAERLPSIDSTDLRKAKRVRLLFRDRLSVFDANPIKRKRLGPT